MQKKLIHPERLRQIPANFSWLDHRLVRNGHLKGLSAESIAFYLFLVSVGDNQGLSFYSNKGISKLLSLKEVNACRRELIAANLLAYADGLYQVLELPMVATYKASSLPSPKPTSPPTLRVKPSKEEALNKTGDDFVNVSECLRKLLEDFS